MTRAQHDAIMEIAENGERYAPHDLNVPKRTVASIAKRGWIALINGRAEVTPQGWAAVAALA